MKTLPSHAKATLTEYRLSNADFLGLKWQDKRNGESEVYKRYFPSAADLRDFLTEYFGVKTMRRVFTENADLLP